MVPDFGAAAVPFKISISMILYQEYCFNKRGIMNLGIKCKKCLTDLTMNNARKRLGVPSGYRPLCKPCRNAYERQMNKGKIRWDKRAPLVPCGHCKTPCARRGKMAACSLKCRFMQYVKINSKTLCWEWQGIIKRDGYGILYIDKKGVRAHRVSYDMFKSNKCNDMYVCHSCDITYCVNPEHLWLGTNQDNQMDSVMKKRNRHAKDKRRDNGL